MPAKGFSITNSGRIDMFDMNKEGKKETCSIVRVRRCARATICNNVRLISTCLLTNVIWRQITQGTSTY